MTTQTIYFGAVDLQPSTLKYRFWLMAPPTTHPAPEVRGEDIVVPSASGRTVGTRVADRLLIPLRGWVGGQGGSGDGDRADFLSSWDTLGAVFDPTVAPASLVVYGPLEGVASGKKRTITARFLSALPIGGIPGVVMEYDVQMEAVGSPPVWVEADNS
jgi:hypothetical protein